MAMPQWRRQAMYRAIEAENARAIPAAVRELPVIENDPDVVDTRSALDIARAAGAALNAAVG
jgi:hypothetical protein